MLNHVLLHQTIIGQEAKKQMELAGEYPDILIACHGGGSNFAGLAFPFLKDKLKGGRTTLRAIAVEPAACPSLTAGTREYDFGDTAGTTPLMMMHTLGHDFMPAPVHAGGPPLPRVGAARQPPAGGRRDRSRGVSPGRGLRERASRFARCEGTIPAPESAHAIHSVVQHALAARESGEKKVIVFNLSGHGVFDLGGVRVVPHGQDGSKRVAHAGPSSDIPPNRRPSHP